MPRLKKIASSAFSGKPEQFEIKIKNKNGNLIDVWIKLNSIYKNETIEGLIATGRNITEKKISGNLLGNSEEKFRTLVENSNDIIWSLDVNGKFVYINRAAESISGYTSEEVMGKSYAVMLFEEDAARIKNIFNSVISGNSNKYEIKVKKKNGGVFVLSVNTAPILKKDKVVGTVSFGRDIAEQKIREEKLQKEYSFRRSIEYSLLAGIAIVDLNQVMTYVNPSFCKMVDYDKDDLIGKKPPFIFWHPDEAQAIAESLKKKVKGEVPMSAFELKFHKKTGETLFVLGLHSPIKDSQEKLTAWMAVFSDITERKNRKRNWPR